MKKLLSLVLALLMVCAAVSALAEGEIKIGQVDFAAHGTHCFAVITAVVQDDVIVAAKIDEFQFMGDREDLAAIGVPNAELASEAFSVKDADGNITTKLGSKRVNSDLYSLNMQRAGSTVQIAANYDYIEAYATGKTIAELEAATADVESAAFVDVVTGATTADTLGYVKGIIAAAKAASNETGTYTFYNKTGEVVKELYLVDNLTGEKGVNYAVNGFAADAKMVVTRTITAEEKASGYSMTVAFKTEGGYEGTFPTLHIEVAPITLLAADALTGATQISFFAPAE